MHAAEDDRPGRDARRLTRELEGVADEVGDLEDLRPLVVVRQDDGVALPLERLHLGDRAGERLAPGGRVTGIAEPAEQGLERRTGGRGGIGHVLSGHHFVYARHILTPRRRLCQAVANGLHGPSRPG